MSLPIFAGALRRTFPVVALALAGCAPMQDAQVTMGRGSDALTEPALPAMQSFPGRSGSAPVQSNASIARDILELQFAMESGRPLTALGRFEGPITIALAGDIPATAPADLARVVRRLQAEAGLDVRIAPKGVRGDIVMEFQPRAALKRVVPTAACFVVPGVASFAEYRANRAAPKTDWTTLTKRHKVAIFAPSDTTPQEVRDCLHEEVAQAMGPLNDLYRLSDSVFNDDNFHTVLTGFDMLVLRVHNDPALQSGMTKAEVAARLPAILARVNPAGQGAGVATDASATPRAWSMAVEAALGAKGSVGARKAAAGRMLAIARAQGWRDGRLALSLFAHGRAHATSDLPEAVAALREAARLYRALPGGAVQAAHIDMQLAAFAIGQGRPDEALMLAERSVPVVTAAENASLLATLHLIRALAYDRLGQPAQSREARLDSLGWARYGFGSDAQVRARMNEIAGLASRAGKG